MTYFKLTQDAKNVNNRWVSNPINIKYFQGFLYDNPLYDLSKKDFLDGSAIRVRWFFAMLLLPVFAAAQKEPNLLVTPRDPLSVGVFLGMSNYWGDLVKGYPLVSNSDPAVGIMFNYQLWPRLGVRGSFNYGKLKSDGTYYEGFKGSQASFKRTFLELGLLLEYDFISKRCLSDKLPRPKLIPYLVGGFLGFGYGAPSYTNVILEGGKVTLALPFGLGIRYQVHSNIYLAAEFVTRTSFSDNMDGIIGTGGYAMQ